VCADSACEKLGAVCLLLDTRPAQLEVLVSAQPPPRRAAMPELLRLMSGGTVMACVCAVKTERARSLQEVQEARPLQGLAGYAKR
jgi:hypothetical protein